MLLKTKVWIASLAALALVGTAAAAAAPDADLSEGGVDAASSFAMGRWTKDNASVSARFVSFSYDAATGAISDYARVTPDGEKVIFSSITFASYNASDAKAKARGAVLVAKSGDDLRAVVFDARNAAFGIGSPAGNTVTLVVADGITVERNAGEEGWSREGVLLRDGNQTARLVVNGNGDVSVSGQTITVTLDEGGRVGFRIDGHPVEELKEKGWLLKARKHLKDKRGPKHDGERGRAPGETMKQRADERRAARQP